MGASKLKCPRSQVASRLERIDSVSSMSNFRSDRADQETRHILDQYPGLAAYEEQILGVVRRNLRTPAFLVRYMPLGEDLDARSLAGAMHDASRNGESLAEVLHRFCAFLAGRSEDEQARYVDALVKVQTGAHVGTEVTSLYSDDELQGSQPSALLPNVRLVNGSVRQETRQRLMLTFNTPFYPEVLIASSVLAEGVDLHPIRLARHSPRSQLESKHVGTANRSA